MIPKNELPRESEASVHNWSTSTDIGKRLRRKNFIAKQEPPWIVEIGKSYQWKNRAQRP